MSPALLLGSALFGPLAGAVLVAFTKRHIKYTQWFSAAFSLISFAAFLMIYKAGEPAVITIDVGMPFLLKVGTDALSIFMGLITCFVWLLASVYSVEYIEHRKTIFNVFLMLSLFGMLGIVIAANIFSLLLFFELFSIASATLIIHDLTRKAIIAGFQYLFISVLGTVAIIIATALIYKAAGSIDFTGSALLAGKPAVQNFSWIFILMVFGFSIKAGLFPVHVWLPEAHPIAPSSASALLSGVMIKAGAYGIIRTIYSVFGTDALSGKTVIPVLIAVAVFTMIYGSVLAITQTEFKRLLAYSSIAQIGYVVLGASLLSASGLKGGVFHIFVHAFMKGALFLSAGTIIHKTGIKKIADLKGIGRYMPVTMMVITFSALSMIGIPPFAGFLSKWMLAQGALEASGLGTISRTGAYIVIGGLVLSGLLNVLYYAPIIIAGWLKEPKLAITGASHDDGDENKEIKGGWLEPSWRMMVPALILAAGTLIFGIFPGLPMELSEAVARLYF